jgi:RNA polymerase sigma-70 factor (ECF subfamily)
MTGRPGDLEDLVQEVFLQVYRSIKDFRGQSRFSTWLYRLTVNVVLMHRRAARSRPVLQAGSDDSFGADVRDLPDDQLSRARRVAAFYRLLDRLSDKKRAVFVLHELEGLSPSEVAKVVRAPVLTVRTRLFYARRELLGMLRDEPALEFVARELREEQIQSESDDPLTESETT